MADAAVTPLSPEPTEIDRLIATIRSIGTIQGDMLDAIEDLQRRVTTLEDRPIVRLEPDLLAPVNEALVHQRNAIDSVESHLEELVAEVALLKKEVYDEPF